MCALLKIENLSIGYSKNPIYKGINAEENEGELVALIGGNGRGKSTLLRTIAGLIPLYGEGSVLLGERRIEELTGAERNALVAFVGTATERTKYLKTEDLLTINAYFRTDRFGSMTDSEHKKIIDALQMVGLQGFEKRDCATLSDGEYQRAVIAAALVQESNIVLLDEPTAFLDVANKFIISRLLAGIAHGSVGAGKKLIIFSTHDIQLALQVCDKLWVMAPEHFYTGEPQVLFDEGIMDRVFDVEGVLFDRATKSYKFKE